MLNLPVIQAENAIVAVEKCLWDASDGSLGGLDGARVKGRADCVAPPRAFGGVLDGCTFQ